MKYNLMGDTGVAVSALGLGGHEFLGDGSSRGFHEDFARAVTPGEIFEGYGADKRARVLAAAYGAGINLFDATIDSEKEALGRNLRTMPPPYPVFAQTRPEGMAYHYDRHNRKMADYGLLRAEVVRIIGLLRRDQINFFNFPFMASALENDADYLDKICRNVAALKAEGLIGSRAPTRFRARRHTCGRSRRGASTRCSSTSTSPTAGRRPRAASGRRPGHGRVRAGGVSKGAVVPPGRGGRRHGPGTGWRRSP